VVEVCLVVLDDEVEMVLGKLGTGRSLEGFTPRHAHLAPPSVADPGEPLDRRPDELLRGDDDVEVDDRLRRQAWHRGRPDVVDADSDVRDRRPHDRADPLEPLGPGRVVVGDDDRAADHAQRQHLELALDANRRQAAVAARFMLLTLVPQRRVARLHLAPAPVPAAHPPRPRHDREELR
jgi:hypothetical protein